MRCGRRALQLLLVAGLSLSAQTNYYFRGSDATGRLTRTAVTNAGQAAAAVRQQSLLRMKAAGSETKTNIVYPQPRNAKALFAARVAAMSAAPSLNVNPASSAFNFLGLTHYDQRNANGGNQFSVEPPSPDIAVANGWVLEGVNNAIQVYSSSGFPMLARALSTNELFAVAPAIDRATGINGVYPTDMRVFYDHGIDRWFVVQRAQDYDIRGDPLSSSHLYLAVSQSGDPTGNYTIYTMDTTNSSRPGCPCFSDFPQIGADQYGVYISVDEYGTGYGNFAGVRILAISKAGLAAASASPKMQELVVPRLTGFEATVRPAMTPPGASYMLAQGGVQFFVSTQSLWYTDNRFGLWALTNTASLNTTPDLTLILTIIAGIPYTYPDVATQKPGFLPYGSTLFPPGQLALIHGGRDSRVLSLVYAAGRLYVTMATDAMDDNGAHVVAGAYAVLLPFLRGNVLAAPVSLGGYLRVRGNHVLRPAVAVNPQGGGAIAFTLVGPDYYPSAAFVPVEKFVPSTTLQVVGAGAGPQDGFSGYPDLGVSSVGVARWGDYSGAVAAADGSIWMTVEYIPAAPRTEFANWGTRVIRHGR